MKNTIGAGRAFKSRIQAKGQQRIMLDEDPYFASANPEDASKVVN
jgi:hypothetical protein